MSQNDQELQSKGQNQNQKTPKNEFEGNDPTKATTTDLTLVFLITVFIPVAAYITFTMPQLFEAVSIQKFGITTLEFEGLYTIYSLPNFVVVPLGTLMLSYIGLGLGVVIFNGLIYGGLLIMYFGFFTNTWWIVMFGRGFYGLGSENIGICGPAIFGKWFIGKALSVSQAINRSFTQASISLSIIVMPQVFVKARRMDEVFLLYALVAFVSFIFSVLYALFEFRYENRANWTVKDKNSSEGDSVVGKLLNSKGSLIAAAKANNKRGGEIRKGSEGNVLIGQERGQNQAQLKIRENKSEVEGSASGLESNFLNSGVEILETKNGESIKKTKINIDEMFSDLTEKDKTFTLKDVKYFSPLFWMLAIIFAVGTQGYMMFDTFGTDFMMNRLGYDYKQATLLYSAISISTIILIPISSFLTQALGYKGVLLFVSNFIGMVCFLTFLILPPKPNVVLHLILLIGLGLFSSLLLAIIWPCMTLVVSARGCAIALGMATTIQNLLIFSLPLYFGYINKPRSVASYNLSMISMGALIGFSALLSFIAMIYDFKNGNLLHLPENSKKVADLRDKLEIEYLKRKSREKNGGVQGLSEYGTMADVKTRTKISGNDSSGWAYSKNNN